LNSVPSGPQKIIGAIIFFGIVGATIGFGGFRLITFPIVLFVTGLFSIFLYSIKTEKWYFFILKIIANIIFNPFFLLLLIRSWTLLRYKAQFEELDKKVENKNI